jgi:diaminohydroxyphosphoribosylaminopyrimidine deaminase/5-amino-6-(5-phosphoribosylamino)uracil reductase
MSDDATTLVSPFVKLTRTGRPYVHAKWAMSLDGKIATRTGASRWISNEASRARAHQLRGRMDAILIGAGTAKADNPLLTARPAGPRTAARIVVDSRASLAIDSQLVRTKNQAPVIVATCVSKDDINASRLSDAGVEMLHLPPDTNGRVDLAALLDELGRRKMTNILVEGGPQLLGSMFDGDLVDEVHVFIGNKLIGGSKAPSPLSGSGLAEVPTLPQFDRIDVENLDGDVYIHGRITPRDRIDG